MNDRKFRFNPTISFDGVAIILACIFAAVAWGRITKTVEEHSTDITQLKSTAAELNVRTTQLEVRVDERTRRTVP